MKRQILARLLPLLLIPAGAAALLGGTCSAPPPYHDLSGTWVNATWGPGAEVALEGHGPVDLDLALTVEAPLPDRRGPVAVTGVACVGGADGRWASGVYVIDPAESTYSGADYGGARLDLVAVATDGRRVEITQAFMHNARPDGLDGAIIALVGPSGAPREVFRFEGFRRAPEVSCP